MNNSLLNTAVPFGNAMPDAALQHRFLALRSRSERLARPLSAEDMTVQSMPDASPMKWHLAHTTWFFETFLLSRVPGFVPFDPQFAYLFNSYYEALGPRQPRPQRGLITRPIADEIMAYRKHVDAQVLQLLRGGVDQSTRALLALGFAHEEQHQELMLMDILHLFSQSPLKPAYDTSWPALPVDRIGRFTKVAGGLREQGAQTGDFAFDNELPRHSVWLHDFEISDRLVTNAEWLSFMRDGGYHRPGLWLADGWAEAQTQHWEAPLYWEYVDGTWLQMTLAGLRPVELNAPVMHISYFEAAAYASWARARLPTEAEWEAAAVAGMMEQQDDIGWQWTQSAYTAYPGFHAAVDAVGEYNGKFMSNQMVLRGGATVTPAGHTRATYRNFYRPQQRWMFSSVRLARDVNRGASFAARHDEFAADVVTGLSAKQKSLSPKYFYDGVGSKLFEDICLTPEYYPTRTETSLLRVIADEITAEMPDGAVLVEFGSGASDKTRLLLDAAPRLGAYVPIDISAEALEAAAARLTKDYPDLMIAPLVGDFTTELTLPPALELMPKVGFFPGSTIGNFLPEQAVNFLRSALNLLGPSARMVVGADIVKDEATLIAAYDDEQGVTAQFNLNLLTRINRELSGDFNLAAFDHMAKWNTELARMEMHLVSRADQIVNVRGRSFAFKTGESLHTENSHKFTTESFSALALSAGWHVEKQWISAAPEFAVFCLTPIADHP